MKRELKAKKADLMAKLADMPDSQLKVRCSVLNSLLSDAHTVKRSVLDEDDAVHWHIAVALFALKQGSFLGPNCYLLLITHPAHRSNGSLAARCLGTF